MTTFTQPRPEPGQLAYYRLTWMPADHGYAPIVWYEVDHDGRVLRMIDVFLDGRIGRDSMANYPDGASEYGFGTLIGDEFYRGPWEWPAADDREQVALVDATRVEFEAIWDHTGR
jgi:hypothetical protein